MTDENNVHPLPAQGVVFDLDAQERDPKDVKPPFVAKVGDRVVTMTDPEEIDWQDLLDIGDNPVMFLRYCVTAEERDYIFGLSMPGWKLGRLMENYMRHYEIDEKIKRFQRQQRMQQV